MSSTSVTFHPNSPQNSFPSHSSKQKKISKLFSREKFAFFDLFALCEDTANIYRPAAKPDAKHRQREINNNSAWHGRQDQMRKSPTLPLPLLPARLVCHWCELLRTSELDSSNKFISYHFKSMGSYRNMLSP
jgi:hypothetical protein